jgi:hypothetical protein
VKRTSIASDIAMREKARKASVVDRQAPAASAVRASKRRRPSQRVAATAPRAAATDTRRADAGSAPNARKAAAIVQYARAGLSKNGSPW